MKTISIPTYNNPFIVKINNNEYIYKGGETIEVPDEVAEAIENALALEPKPKRYLSKFAQRAEGSISEVSEGDLNGISTIYSYAFYNCDGIEGIAIPNSVKSIGGFAFAYCEKLKSIVLPESIISIDGRAFAESNNLSRVILKAVTPPSITTNTVEYIPKTCVFEVPSASLAIYKSSAEWAKIAGQIVAIEE